jgi:hypothetical protein
MVPLVGHGWKALRLFTECQMGLRCLKWILAGSGYVRWRLRSSSPRLQLDFDLRQKRMSTCADPQLLRDRSWKSLRLEAFRRLRLGGLICRGQSSSEVLPCCPSRNFDLQRDRILPGSAMNCSDVARFELCAQSRLSQLPSTDWQIRLGEQPWALGRS